MSKLLPYKDFVSFAPVNTGVTRIRHETDYCTGRSKSLKIERTDDGGISAICFRCGRSGHCSGDPYVRLAAKINTKAGGLGGNEVNGKPSSHIRNKFSFAWYSLPRGATQDVDSWPLEARYWAKRSLSDHDIKRLGLCYDPGQKRVCIPLPVSNPTRTGYLARAVMPDDEGPKYVAHLHPEDDFILYTDKGTREVVFVEDYLSYLQVSQVCSCICLMGTTISTRNLIYAIDYDRFIVWLDNDNPIVKMLQVKLQDRLSAFGECVIYKGTDPKKYSVFEIYNVVKECFDVKQK